MSASPAPPPTSKRQLISNSRPGKQMVQVVKALYPYTAQRSDELTFDEGAVLYVISKDNPDWWLCKCDDKQGLVPSNYVGENTAEMDNPLHEAAKRGNLSFAQELLAAGVSANSLDKAGNSPLHWACRGGHLDVVKLLLGKNVTINVQNKLGDTPLHLSAWGGHPAVVDLLLNQEGIKTTLKNNDGQTPVQLAKVDAVAALLLNFNGSLAAADMGESDED
ncbi:Osteoclast-stimulating factor 1 [Boothiomyces sp. JEL0866]|nr:Osteoclast-stimulating factor 1 [Boothiomyces sp. JEL0866]